MKLKLITKYILRIILVIATIFWMTVIFGFSAADGEESRSTSDRITAIIIENFYEEYDNMTPESQERLWGYISFIVRKTGHFGEYAILAVLVSLFLMTYEHVRSHRGYLFMAVVFCAVYAATDEVHQGFVAGRSPKITDVCIDSAGALCGTVFVCILSDVAERLGKLGSRQQKARGRNLENAG